MTPSRRCHLSPVHPCSYLPGRLARTRWFDSAESGADDYEQLLAARWRRAGAIIYQPACPDCALCQPIRLPVAAFAPSASQRRTIRQNAALSVELSTRLDDPEAVELYCRYQRDWHGAGEPPDPAGVRDFLGLSAVPSRLMLYRLEGCLVGAGWVDILPRGLSSVYFAFDPAHARRRLGVYSLLMEIALARELGKDWLYLGFWIPGCPTMDYKAGYRPHEILADGIWRRSGDPGDGRRGSIP